MPSVILPPSGGLPDPTAANAPELGFTSTSNRPFLVFDAGTDQKAVWQFRLPDDYVGTPELHVIWGADTATTGNVVWAAEVMKLTPNTDTTDADTDGYDTANTNTDAHDGTTAGRLHTATITLTNEDSMAAGDYVAIRVSRDADNASDTMAGDAFVHAIEFEYA